MLRGSWDEPARAARPDGFHVGQAFQPDTANRQAGKPDLRRCQTWFRPAMVLSICRVIDLKQRGNDDILKQENETATRKGAGTDDETHSIDALVAGECCVPHANCQPVPATAPARVDFNRQIRPILSESCYQCHGPDRNKRKADLQARSARRLVPVGRRHDDRRAGQARGE